MEETCRRAVEIGLPAVAFTEHVDLTPWAVREGELDGYPHLKQFVPAGGDALIPPVFDAEGYLEAVERCRHLFPGLRIVTGVEFGEIHRYPAEAAALLDGNRFDRVLGSLHCVPVGDRFFEVGGLYAARPPEEVLRDYLAEVPALISGDDRFGVLAHIDYAIRYWPEGAARFDPHDFEDEFRHALRTLAVAGRTLEVNTRRRPMPEIVRWWREEGGATVSFGSDAHSPDGLAHGFAEAAAMVEAHGFRAGRHPHDMWHRA
jgi:histidinol-phosphatase (PHP family)